MLFRLLQLLICLMPYIHVSAGLAAVFGADDRRESLADGRAELARATAVMISPVNYNTNKRGLIDLDFAPMTETWGVCSEARFASQPVAPIPCTGFLIAPDLLVTAGHCMLNSGEIRDGMTPFCESFSWLFDYRVERDGSVGVKDISPDRIVACKRVIYAVNKPDYDKAKNHYTFRRDIALIQLERALPGRRNFKFANEQVRRGDAVATIGYPLGLPVKTTLRGKVTDLGTADYFSANLDVLGGNSGGPVLNSRDEVVGVVVRSFPDDDLVAHRKLQCDVLNTCDENGNACLHDAGGYPAGTQLQRIPELLSTLD